MNKIISNRNSILSTRRYVSLLKGLSLFLVLCSLFYNRAEAQIFLSYPYQQDTLLVYMKPQVEAVEESCHHNEILIDDSLHLIFTGVPPFFVDYDTNFFLLPDAFGTGYYPIVPIGNDPVTCMPQYMAVVFADLNYYHNNYDMYESLDMASSHIEDSHLGIRRLFDTYCSNLDVFVPMQIMCSMAHAEDSLLPFEEYVIAKWCNTFMLNINLLDSNGIEKHLYCIWYENGVMLDSGDFYTYGNNAETFVEGYTYSFALITASGKVIWSTEKIFHCEEEDVIKIYPNPVASNSEMIIDLGSLFMGEKVTIEIVDMWGRTLKSIETTSSKIAIPASFARGSYVLKVKDIRHKFIVY